MDILDGIDDVNSAVKKPPSLDAAIALLSCSTKGVHNEVGKKFIETFNIPVLQLPSYHMMTKNRPKLVSVNLTTNSNNSFLCDYMMDGIDSASEPDDVLVHIVPEASKSDTDFVGKVSVDFEDVMKAVNESKNQVMSCRFEGR